MYDASCFYAVMTQEDRQHMARLQADNKQLQHENMQLRELLALEKAANGGLYESLEKAQEQTRQMIQVVEKLEGIKELTTSMCTAAQLPFLLAADYLVERAGVFQGTVQEWVCVMHAAPVNIFLSTCWCCIWQR
jgi:hypothetical protein